MNRFFLILLTLIMASCTDHTPVKQSGSQFATISDKQQKLYNSISYNIWSDSSNNPTVAVVSIALNSPRPDERFLGYESNFYYGKAKYIKISNQFSIKQLPLFEEQLVSTKKVPVYFANNNQSIQKFICSYKELDRFKKSVEEKNVEEIKLFFSKKAEQALVLDADKRRK